jgi:mannosyltransferase OCH1-like enzyme
LEFIRKDKIIGGIDMSNIPKVIHYCWFGGNPLPEEYVKYIDSWKKYLPDYEIKRWDESNFDFSTCDYAREAYEAKNNCDRRPQTVINTVLAAVTGDVNFIM